MTFKNILNAMTGFVHAMPAVDDEMPTDDEMQLGADDVTLDEMSGDDSVDDKDNNTLDFWAPLFAAIGVAPADLQRCFAARDPESYMVLYKNCLSMLPMKRKWMNADMYILSEDKFYLQMAIDWYEWRNKNKHYQAEAESRLFLFRDARMDSSMPVEVKRFDLTLSELSRDVVAAGSKDLSWRAYFASFLSSFRFAEADAEEEFLQARQAYQVQSGHLSSQIVAAREAGRESLTWGGSIASMWSNFYCNKAAIAAASITGGAANPLTTRAAPAEADFRASYGAL